MKTIDNLLLEIRRTTYIMEQMQKGARWIQVKEIPVSSISMGKDDHAFYCDHEYTTVEDHTEYCNDCPAWFNGLEDKWAGVVVV